MISSLLLSLFTCKSSHKYEYDHSHCDRTVAVQCGIEQIPGYVRKQKQNDSKAISFAVFFIQPEPSDKTIYSQTCQKDQSNDPIV